MRPSVGLGDLNMRNAGKGLLACGVPLAALIGVWLFAGCPFRALAATALCLALGFAWRVDAITRRRLAARAGASEEAPDDHHKAVPAE